MSTQFETFMAEVLRFGDALPDQVRAAFSVVRLMAGSPVFETVPVRSLIEDCDSAGALEVHPALLLWVPLLAFSTGDPDLEERQLVRPEGDGMFTVAEFLHVAVPPEHWAVGLVALG